MIKILPALLLVCFCTVTFAQKIKPRTVTVASMDELMKEIESNKIIKIKAERLLLSNLKNVNSSLISLQTVFDGLQVEIKNVKNLSIEGILSKPTKMLTATRYANVLTFRDCENISISNIEAGHSPAQGYCTGGVLAFYNCRNVNVSNSLLFGSGTEGLTLQSVIDAKFEKVTIRSCTYGIMTLTNVRNAAFNYCRFTDNQEFDLINISDSESISYTQCQFDYNRTGSGQPYDNYALFNVPMFVAQKNEIVTLNKCQIEDNFCQFFCRTVNALKITDSIVENNVFEKGYNSNK